MRAREREIEVDVERASKREKESTIEVEDTRWSEQASERASERARAIETERTIEIKGEATRCLKTDCISPCTYQNTSGNQITSLAWIFHQVHGYLAHKKSPPPLNS